MAVRVTAAEYELCSSWDMQVVHLTVNEMGIKFLEVAHAAAMLCGKSLIASKQFKQCSKLVKLQNQVEAC